MKKKVYCFLFVLQLVASSFARAQCVPICDSYTINPVTYTLLPVGGIVVPLADDDTTAFLPLGFNFNFYCVNYNQVKICSNGFITFDNTPFPVWTSPYAQSLPSSNLPNSVIAFNWNDFDPAVGGSVSYTTIGSSPNQKFIVTYSNVPIWNSNPPILNTGQIVLSEADNSIEIHIAQAGNNGWLTATEGIEDSGASIGDPAPGRNLSVWTATNSALRWEKLTQPTAPTSLSGPTLVCYGALQNFTCDPMPGAVSYNWIMPNGWIGNSYTNSLSVNAGQAGLVSVNASYSCGLSPLSALMVNVNPAPNISVTSYSPSVVCEGSSSSIHLSGASTYTIYPGGYNGVSPITAFPLATGIYSLFGTDFGGCTSVVPANILISTTPSPTISVNSGSICLGQTFDLNPTGAFTYTYSNNSTSSVMTPSISGVFNYFVIGTNIYGCTGTATSNLVVKNTPNVNAIASKTLVCAKESVTLSVSGAASYTWSNASTAQTININPTTSATYTVTGINSEGCFKDKTVSVTVNPCLYVNEQLNNKRLTFYPNPSQGLLQIHVDEKSQVLLFDALGKQVYSNVINNPGLYSVNLENLDNGSYFINIFTDTGLRSGIWIKQ